MIKLSPTLLISLGLNENQASVYTAALELGQANIQDISRKSGVKRTTIYTFIDELMARGYIVKTNKHKQHLYSAVDPEQLLELEKTRITELERALPELKAIQNKAKNKPRVTFYEGIEGIKEVYVDMLRDRQEIVAFEDLEHMKSTIPKDFFDYFPSERARRNITFKSILRDSPFAEDFIKHNTGLLRESKLIKSSNWKTEINIYGDKTALMSFRSTPPFCVLIEDHNIAETIRSAWQELWNRLGASIG